MKKPAGVTKEQWAKYKGDLELALKVMNKALDVVADANFLAGEQVERERIIKLLEGFDPRTAIGDLLPLLIKGEQK